MKCRAKMIDGSPVTFEFIDHGMIHPEHPQYSCLRSEMTGEGFYVNSIFPSRSTLRSVGRKECDRLALERAGVVTATVQYWIEGKRWPRFTDGSSDTFWQDAHWHPLFPPPSRTPVMDTLLGKFGEPESFSDTMYLERMSKPPPGKFWSDATGKWEPRYVGAEGLVTDDMGRAGCAALKDGMADLIIDRERIWFKDALKVVERIWRAMEKARTK